MWQHNVWWVCVCCVERYAGLLAVQHTSPHRTVRVFCVERYVGVHHHI